MNDESIKILETVLEDYKCGIISINMRDHHGDSERVLYDIWFDELQDDLYCIDALNSFVEDDIISPLEEGFFLGYLNA